MKINTESVKTFKPVAGTIVENKHGEFYLIGVDVHKDYYLINLNTGYVASDSYDEISKLLKNYFGGNVSYYDGEESELNLGGRK